MWSQIGIFIWIWLGAGFIVGLKAIYLDKWIDQLDKEIESGKTEMSDDAQALYKSLKNKRLFFIIVFTLLGFLSFVGDTIRTFRSKDE